MRFSFKACKPIAAGLMVITAALPLAGISIPAQAQSSAYSSTQANASAPRIDGFDVEQVSELTPGTELKFSVYGTPDAQVSLTLGAIKSSVLLEEVRPGEYEGAYTLKTRDKLTRKSTIIATLKSGSRSTRASLARPLLASLEAAPTRASSRADTCRGCGVVEAINVVDVKGEGGVVGVLGGGVAGGLLGNQIGKGSGRTAAQIAGALGGAYAGHEIEGRVKSVQRYEVVVRLQNGDRQTVNFEAKPDYQVGDRVSVDNETLSHR